MSEGDRGDKNEGERKIEEKTPKAIVKMKYGRVPGVDQWHVEGRK